MGRRPLTVREGHVPPRIANFLPWWDCLFFTEDASGVLFAAVI
ncbi:hypothetical protein THTE_0904 [Thermogutta terrifontis]|uniref:Uncharacterized protein n=1 Tax=Thermogutta terrifontis TaxID=1331910 RepID=A0A286RC26_9BACT|nr:hypothetical protein THTE_0904 [Thermogutta terrifontis]